LGDDESRRQQFFAVDPNNAIILVRIGMFYQRLGDDTRAAAAADAATPLQELRQKKQTQSERS
jgi:hypothetical protein